MACRILVPKPGIEFIPPVVEACSQPLDLQEFPRTLEFKIIFILKRCIKKKF